MNAERQVTATHLFEDDEWTCKRDEGGNLVRVLTYEPPEPDQTKTPDFHTKTPWESAAMELLAEMRTLCIDSISCNGTRTTIEGGRLNGIKPVVVTLSKGDKRRRFADEQWTSPVSTCFVSAIADKYGVNFTFEAQGGDTSIKGRDISSVFLDNRMLISVVFTKKS
ncbi:hypothetical protein JW758_04780 [Candidatus Peregrinibacteria bacterium]|nr:hypothetical protein [Candidatus Peregrinibacteria bacterium]